MANINKVIISYLTRLPKISKNDKNDTSTNCNDLFNFPNTPQSK